MKATTDTISVGDLVSLRRDARVSWPKEDRPYLGRAGRVTRVSSQAARVDYDSHGDVMVWPLGWLDKALAEVPR
jgi:hypothetical protein